MHTTWGMRQLHTFPSICPQLYQELCTQPPFEPTANHDDFPHVLWIFDHHGREDHWGRLLCHCIQVLRFELLGWDQCDRMPPLGWMQKSMPHHVSPGDQRAKISWMTMVSFWPILHKFRGSSTLSRPPTTDHWSKVSPWVPTTVATAYWPCDQLIKSMYNDRIGYDVQCIVDENGLTYFLSCGSRF